MSSTQRDPQRPWSIGLRPWQRALVERAAQRAGLPASTWAREKLIELARLTAHAEEVARDG